ncbi:MAG TPA: PAS domain S-box protein [Candidatus Binatia bacterium]|nr:PAS domain S-box protein [Candidatus Binatia bacterium]
MRPTSDEKPRHRAPILVWLIGLGLTAALIAAEVIDQRRPAIAQFHRAADARTTVFQHDLDIHLRLQSTINAFMSVSAGVDLDDFQHFVRQFSSRSGVHEFFAYAPRLTPAEVKTFETQWRRRNEDFRIRPAPGSSSQPLLPLAYLEPQTSASNWLGVDLLRTRLLDTAVTRAVDSGTAAASAPAYVRSGEHTLAMIYVVHPHYLVRDPAALSAAERRDALLGVSLGAYRLDDLLGEALIDSPWYGWQVMLYDGQDPGATAWSTHGAPANAPAEPLTLASALEARQAYRTQIWIAQRPMTLVFLPGSGLASAAVLDFATVAIGLLGLALTAMAHFFFRRRRAALHLADQNARLQQAILGATMDAMVTADEHGLIVDWSVPAEDMFGWKADEVRGRDLAEVIFAPAERPAQQRELQRLLSAGEGAARVLSESTAVRRDGSTFPVEMVRSALAEGGGRRLVAFHRDITERRKHMQELERLSMVASKTNKLIFFLDAEARSVWICNALVSQLGYGAEEMLGRPFLETVMRLRVPDPELQEIHRALSGATPLRREIASIARSGVPHWLLLDLTPYREAGARPAGFIAVLTDITQLRQAQEVLRHTQKMEAMGQLTGGLAHDFNNLLAVIVGNLDLASFVPEPERVQKHVDVALKAALSGTDLTKALLAVARKQPLEPEPLDLVALLNEAMPLIRHTAGARVQVVQRLGASAVAMVDRGGFNAAILNLVVNAHDAMPAGGQLTLSTYERALDAGGEQDLGIPRGDYIVVEVADTGRGMAPETLQRAMDPFFTTKPRGRGTGLGLSTVYSLTRQLGGTTRIFSEIGKGTCVQLYLPSAAPAVTLPDEASRAALPGGRERVLLVENEVALLDVVEQWLRDLGYQVVATDSGERAAEILKGDEDFELLFTDVVMPGPLDGVDLARLSRQVRPHLAVVVTSGFSERYEEHRRSLDAAFLQKPYSKSELALALRRALDEAAERAGRAPGRPSPQGPAART